MAKISVIGICGKSSFFSVDHFHAEGETLSAESLFEEMGGKGINQAIAASRLGGEVSFLAAVGDDEEKNLCRKLLKKEGIRYYLSVKSGRRTPNAVILTDKNGSNRVTVFKDAELDESDVEAFRGEIEESDVLLLQNEVPDEVNRRAIEIASEKGVRVILNPAPARALDGFYRERVYLVTPNEQEAELISASDFENRVTTLGGEGCRVNEEPVLPSLGRFPVDTTGAGDTFNGALALKLAEGKSLREASIYGIVASGISVSKKHVIDAIPYKAEVEENLEKYIKEKLK